MIDEAEAMIWAWSDLDRAWKDAWERKQYAVSRSIARARDRRMPPQPKRRFIATAYRYAAGP